MSYDPYTQLPPRRGKSWTIAENKRLFDLALQKTDEEGRIAWREIAQILDRGSCAISGRYYMLRAGMRFAQEKKR